jgi:glyoxalase family protein
MKPLEGIHHISAITSDAQRNLDFYVGVLGLRLIKKSVNQDHTSVYHLFYGDEQAHPGSDITFFEYPGSPLGRAGAGMIHRIVWRVASVAAIDFWQGRLQQQGYSASRTDSDSLVFADWEGLEHELVVADVPDAPLAGEHPEIPAEHALQGFHKVRAGESEWEARGQQRGGSIVYDAPPEARALQGAGTVHHVAWAMHDEDVPDWHAAVRSSGAHPSTVIDRHYFQSIYFREPSGVLFELATFGPGFTVDEPLEHLGEKLSVTPQFEHLRAQIEPSLTPLRNPRDAWVKS